MGHLAIGRRIEIPATDEAKPVGRLEEFGCSAIRRARYGG
jgi:hypothetical protein